MGFHFVRFSIRALLLMESKETNTDLSTDKLCAGNLTDTITAVEVEDYKVNFLRDQ